MEQSPVLTTAAGAPVADNQNSAAAGPRGPVSMQDHQLMEKMAHFNRERVPERVVHAKGGGATGQGTRAERLYRRRGWTDCGHAANADLLLQLRYR